MESPPQANMSQANMSRNYRIDYTKHPSLAHPYEYFWVSFHETLEETAAKAQAYCVEHWLEPPSGRKEICYYTNSPDDEGGSVKDPYQVASIVLRYKEPIDAGYKLTVSIDLDDPTEHGLIPLHSLDICNPAAVEAREEAENARRRRRVKRFHRYSDEFSEEECD